MINKIMSAAITSAYVIGIFVVAMVSLLLVVDLLILPILLETLQDPARQDWCGIFSRCSGRAQQSFVELLWSGKPWTSLDIISIKRRVERAAVIGAVSAVGFIALTAFRYIKDRKF